MARWPDLPILLYISRLAGYIPGCMRTVTLLSGLALILNAALHSYNFASTLMRIRGYQSTMVPYVLDQASWILAEACMAAFFFILYSRQKN